MLNAGIVLTALVILESFVILTMVIRDFVITVDPIFMIVVVMLYFPMNVVSKNVTMCVKVGPVTKYENFFL